METMGTGELLSLSLRQWAQVVLLLVLGRSF